MPHYADGTEAKVGDFVTGKPYNTPHPIAGTLISISPGAESCNCQVQFTEARQLTIEESVAPSLGVVPRTVRHEARFPGAPAPVVRRVQGRDHGSAGDTFALFECVDYGAVSDFTPVRGGSSLALGVA